MSDFNLPHQRAAAYEYLAALEGDHYMIVRPLEEKRRDIQNKLMWHWNNEVSQFYKSSAKHIHGMTKLEVLFPLMHSWERHVNRVDFLSEIFSRVLDYRHKIGVAYDMIRTRDLTVKELTQYLNEFRMYWSDQGAVLTTSEDYYYEAMGYKRAA